MSKEKIGPETLTELTVKMEVEEIIKNGFEEIKDELDRYFIRKNNETTGHYYPLIIKVNKKSTKLIEKMLGLIKF